MEMSCAESSSECASDSGDGLMSDSKTPGLSGSLRTEAVSVSVAREPPSPSPRLRTTSLSGSARTEGALRRLRGAQAGDRSDPVRSLGVGEVYVLEGGRSRCPSVVRFRVSLAMPGLVEGVGAGRRGAANARNAATSRVARRWVRCSFERLVPRPVVAEEMPISLRR